VPSLAAHPHRCDATLSATRSAARAQALSGDGAERAGAALGASAVALNAGHRVSIVPSGTDLGSEIETFTHSAERLGWIVLLQASSDRARLTKNDS